MTREEIEEEAFWADMPFMKEPVVKLSDVIKIYDDFESRTCENCKWCDKEDKSSDVLHYCGHPSDDMDALTYFPLGFGCNKFERK